MTDIRLYLIQREPTPDSLSVLSGLSNLKKIMKTIELVLVDDQLEYTLEQYLTDKGVVTELKYSMSESWGDHVRGTTAVKVRDDGNGVKILGESLRNIQYDKALQLSIVLNKTVSETLNVEIVKYKGHDGK